ncbi:hypothetical protein ACIQ9P_27600 [Kitasatospora sp. NPDC094019]|uniref:hypothetical protein n=1 Tax=Kitasatospora sp. NPDC094019 TaxID=3364091 RepID=UPI0038300C8D
MSQENPEYVSVPVPAHLVPAVYAFIAERSGVIAGQSAGAAAVDPVLRLPQGEQQRRRDEWTVEDLRTLISDRRDSVQVVVAILDILAERPGTRVGYGDLAEALKLDRTRLRGALSGFTRVLKAHYEREFWPMWWTEVPAGEGRGSEFVYYVSDVVAKRWREARTEV